MSARSASHYRGGRSWTDLLQRARELRTEATDAERLLWQLLRNRQVGGVKFRRQHQFGPFILDFFASELGLVVEVDGGQHFSDVGEARDQARTEFLAARGLRVLRFDNLQVLQEIEGVLEAILADVMGDGANPHPNPLPEGEGV